MDDKKLVNDEEMKEVNGAGCWNSARFVAPDGHDVGCAAAYYRVQFSDLDFVKKFPGVCPVDGGPHDLSGRKYHGNGKYYYNCAKCHHALTADGNYSDNGGDLAEG